MEIEKHDQCCTDAKAKQLLRDVKENGQPVQELKDADASHVMDINAIYNAICFICRIWIDSWRYRNMINAALMLKQYNYSVM